jgi:branched-chain amino acid transport system substrate-binding protein
MRRITMMVAVLRIGLVDETTGPQAEAGVLTLRGAQLALSEINAAGGILGRQVQLVIEDNQSTNPGTVLAFSKLFGEKNIVAIIGPIRSTQTQAASPTIAKAGVPVAVGGTDPSLTRSTTVDLPRRVRTTSYSSRVVAEFGTKDAREEEVGDHPLDRHVRRQRQDRADGGAEVPRHRARADAGVHEQPAGLHGRRAEPEEVRRRHRRQLHRELARRGHPRAAAAPARRRRSNGSARRRVATETALKLAGDALWGTYVVTDFFPDANPEAKAFTAKFKAKHGADPDLYSAWSYAGMHLLKHAIEKAGSLDSEAIRKSILATRGLKGIEGEYAFDANGDGLHGYSIVRNEKGRLAFIRHIEFTSEVK